MRDEVIEIEERWVDEVRASAAELSVQVHGERLFGGEAALEKAREVRALVEALVACGLDAEDVSLTGLRAHVSTGLFTKSSSAYYTLRVRVDDLARLTDVFDAVTRAEQATLLGIRWVHEPSDAVVGGWLGRCARRARAAADHLAEALGARIEGVAHCRSEVLGRDRLEPDQVYLHAVAGAAPLRKRASLAESLDTTELAPSRRMGVRATIGFRIGPRVASAS